MGARANFFLEEATAIQPLALGDVPTDLLDKNLYLKDRRVDDRLYAERLPVYETPWLERKPKQEWRGEAQCAGFHPRHALELVSEDAARRMERWFAAVVLDLRCLEEHGAACDRKDKPDTLVIGQSEFLPCARGYVWDCRDLDGCKLLDYTANINTKWDLDYLRKRLEGYPDRRLASNVLEGIRMEADVELQLVLAPPLVSIGEGFDSVQKTVREMQGMGFYKFLSQLGFAPGYLIGQGSRIKKLGVKKYRRTSNFSGPHRVLTDKQGKRVIAVNDASRCYYVPQWMRDSETLREWNKRRYAHVPRHILEEHDQPPMPSGSTEEENEHQFRPHRRSVRHKFPKELKPSLTDLMNDLTVLLQASIEMEEPLFIWVKDVAFFFNQFGYAPEELHLSNLVTVARDGDATHLLEAFEAGQLIFVSEERLGFGSFASSNIAQRFSNAYVGWEMERFDQLEEEEFQRNPTDAWVAWKTRRMALEPECRRARPRRHGQATTDCTQTRLATAHMFTDDEVKATIGVARAKRLMVASDEILSGIRLVMAGPEKSQTGAHVEWIGVLVLAAIGLVVVPPNKLLRAREAVERTLARQIDFGEYRALVGLLEHLRFIAMLSAEVMNALYRPHGAKGESRGGPSTVIHPDGQMEGALHAWAQVIMSCGGALVTIVVRTEAAELMRAARRVFLASADAAGDGEGTPGMGGYMHGFYWRIALDAATLAVMHITAWETLATVVNILVSARLAGPQATLSMRADALLTPFVIAKEKANSVAIQGILHRLFKVPGYQELGQRLLIQHTSGSGNHFGDMPSRGLWPDFDEACRILRVKTQQVTLTDQEKGLVEDIILEAATRQGVELPADVLRQGWFELRRADEPRPTERPSGDRSRACSPVGIPDVEDDVGESRRSRPKPKTGDPKEPGGAAIRYRQTQREDPQAEQGWARRQAERWKSRMRIATGNGSRGYEFTPLWAEGQPADVPRETKRGRDADVGFVPIFAEPRERRPSAIGQPPRRGEESRRGPTLPPSATYTTPAYGATQLRTDQVEEAERLAKRLANDRSAGRIDASYATLRQWALDVAEVKADGVNPRTAVKNSFALKEFESFAKEAGFDPNLRTEWTKNFPERENLKLSRFLLYRAQRAQPRAKKDRVAKPMSIYQNYLALRRVFDDRGQELPPSAAVRGTLRGLIRRFIRREGIEALRPKQVEPVTPPMIQAAIALAKVGEATVAAQQWTLEEWEPFIITAWMAINLSVGARKGEFTRLPGDVDENDWLTRSSLTWVIGGRVVTNPSVQQLRGLTEGDYALLAPKGAKCDQWGTCHGTEPIVLPWHNNENNAALWLARIEARWPCDEGSRSDTALFCNKRGEPYTDNRFATLINAVLRTTLGEERARMYTAHSWRVWLASGLRMCGGSDARIQAMGRWMNPASLRIYARMTRQEYGEWVDKLMGVTHLDTARTTNLPAMDVADLIGPLQDAIGMGAEAATPMTVRAGRKRVRDEFDERAEAQPRAEEVLVPAGTRVEVYWTDLRQWYAGVVTSNRREATGACTDHRIHRVVYDAVGLWANVREKQLTYWHCFDEENWQCEEPTRPPT